METNIIKYHIIDNEISDEFSNDENYNIIKTIIDENKYSKDKEIIVKISNNNEIIKDEWKFIKQLKNMYQLDYQNIYVHHKNMMVN
jgi:hypothetical protein